MTPSGRFLLRIAPELHETLRASAEAEGLSLNAFCARRLAAPEPGVGGPAATALHRAVEVLGRSPLGIVAFGSWARGEEAEDSDVDLLVIVDPDVPIDRDLYRRWDAEPPRWESRRLEVHFAHPPGPESAISSLWAEMALDGIVLFDRALAVSRLLGGLRRRISDGELERRRVHGQPYWVGAT